MGLFRILSYLALLALVSACEKKEIKVYRVAKETTADSREMPGGGAAGTAARPGPARRAATFEAPATWHALPPAQMREASFLVNGEGGTSADVSLIILGGNAGKTVENVNRWRGQLGQEPTTIEEIEKGAERLKTELGEILLVDLKGLTADADAAKDGRILGAIVEREGGVAWFFKMRGNAELVEREKERFLSWVRSTRAAAPVATESAQSTEPAGASPMTMEAAHASAGVGPGNAPKVEWNVPANWKPAAAANMRFASFEVENPAGEKGDISVVVLAGESGSDLANLNRWRQQLGLSTVNEDEFKSQVTRIGDGDGAMFVADLVASERRMLVGWARRTDKTWFFKLVGPSGVVGDEKDRFVQFLKSVRFN